MFGIFYEPMDGIYAMYEQRIASWDMLGQHYHNTYEIYLLSEGERDFGINGQTFTLKPGELLVVNPYLLHHTQTKSDYITRSILNVPYEAFKGFLDKKESEYLFDGITSCVIPLENGQKEELYRYYKNISEYNKKSELLSDKFVKSYIMQMFEYIKTLMPNATMQFEPHNFVIREEMLEALRFIHSNYTNDDFSLDDVTEHIHMSKSRFCEVFRRTTGYTFLKYLNLIRVMPVEKDLLVSEKPLSKIAEENGFSSVAHMTRIFNSAFGMSPSEYRRRRR